MDNFIINRDNDFKNSNVSSVPLGINNLKINNNSSKFDLKRDDISNNIKPMLSSGANTINISDGKKFKMKPSSGKKVPLNTFSMIANNKKNIGASTSDSDDTSYATEDSAESGTNEILSGNSKTSDRNSKTEYSSTGSEDDDDYSSIESGAHNKNINTTNSQSEYTEEDDDDESDVSKPVKQKSYEEIQQEKQQMLFDLDRLQKQGYPPSKRYSMASPYEDIKYERDRLKKQRDVEKSIRFSRKMLMGTVSGIEWVNKKFDYFDIKLNGWSENVLENISDYDEVFEELHDKYGESVKMAPELKLISMVAGSAALFHITNSIFKSATPQLSDILKQNPDIMRNITEAAAKNMSGTINQQFGDNDFVGNMMKDGMNNKINQTFPQRGPMPSPNGGPFNRPSPQPRMSGPVGIDELLNELNDDNGSVSSSGSVKIKASAKRSTGKKGGIQLSI
jgi:hypothetical protein